MVRKVWETVGHRVNFAVDANRGMTAADTKLLSLACYDIPFTIEQPCNTIEELVSIRSQIVHPIKLDENLESLNDVLRAISLNVCDKFGLKISRLGGLNVMATIRDICEERSIPQTCEDSWGGDIAAAATVHVGATVKSDLLEAVWIASDYIEEHYDPVNGIEIENGFIKIPTGPGLGVSPQEDRIGRLVASYG